MSSEVKDFIFRNWEKTVRYPESNLPHGVAKLPVPFTVPCINEMFTDFYYWDTVFTNLGLVRSGLEKQAENNLDSIKYFIDNLGYMPNANHLLDRSQPPFFTYGVYELWKFKKDDGIVRKYIDSIVNELEFWKFSRTDSKGLSSYGHHSSRFGLYSQRWLLDRVGIPHGDEEYDIMESENLLAIAESGWDFNPRFRTAENPFASTEFYHIDLNSILYDAEVKCSGMLAAIGDARSEEYRKRAETRKNLINRYMLASDGLYRDYNFRKDSFGTVLSCASFYPYAFGISDDKKGALKLLEKLELPHGVSCCEYRGENDSYLQWDYPAMWPTNAYITYLALRNTGLAEEAKRIASKYVETVDKVFEKTGSLWEKYDSAQGDVAYSREYETPKMMGWTAGIYLYFTGIL